MPTQPAETPSYNGSYHTPKQVDTPADESPDNITLQMIADTFASHSPPPTAEEQQQWRSAGWVDPSEWSGAPTQEQLG